MVDLRLRICTNVGRWDLGDSLAGVLPSAVDNDGDGDRYKITCAEYHHGRARSLCAEGDIEGAKERVRTACRLWPPIRLEILDDDALEGIW